MLNGYLVAAVAAMLGADLSASAPRAAFSDCLRESLRQAKAQQVEPGAFDAFMRAHCSAQLESLTKAVVAIDMKNGSSRKQAAENAELEMEDYFVSMTERYAYEKGGRTPE